METAVATKQPSAVRVDETSGLLVYSDQPYELTIDEVHEHFVAGAPYQEEREFLFRMLVNYLEQTRGIVPDRRVWVDGSFTSRRGDRPPRDVDLLLLVKNPTAQQRRELVRRGLLTMSDVNVKVGQKPIPELPKLAPYGGLIDAYYVNVDHSTEVATWEMQWSTQTDENGQPDFEQTKGFVEVISNDQD